MSYEKAMKHERNPRKWKKTQPCIFHAESFNGAKSVWKDEKECPKCSYIRPVMFFENEVCDVCNNKQRF